MGLIEKWTKKFINDRKLTNNIQKVFKFLIRAQNKIARSIMFLNQNGSNIVINNGLCGKDIHF